MSSSTDTTETTCANCGKAESDAIKLEPCTACKLVMYCSSDCQVEHHPKHKEACEKRAAELFDEELFKDTESEECPICMLPLPFEEGQAVFAECCGNRICNGCVIAQSKEEIIGNGKRIGEFGCAFCRAPPSTTDRERIDRIKRGVERNHAGSTILLGIRYMKGDRGFQKDMAKAIELMLTAGKLGCADGYYIVGNLYINGNGVEKDMNRAKHYHELGAIGGCLISRHIIACFEGQAGNHERAYKHFLIGAKAGFEPSMNYLQRGFKNGYITKDEYAGALRAYQKQHEERNSARRDEALPFANSKFWST